MPMKKITFNATLNHKAYSYEPMQIEVEKVILPFTVRGSNRWRDHPLEDTPEIIEICNLISVENGGGMWYNIGGRTDRKI